MKIKVNKKGLIMAISESSIEDNALQKLAKQYPSAIIEEHKCRVCDVKFNTDIPWHRTCPAHSDNN
jgi:hypothetical protein